MSGIEIVRNFVVFGCVSLALRNWWTAWRAMKIKAYLVAEYRYLAVPLWLILAILLWKV